MDLSYILSWFLSPALQESLLIPRIILGSLSFLMLAFIVWAFFHTSWSQFAFFEDFREFIAFRAYGMHRMSQRWQKTLARLETANEAEYKLALIEADSMLEDALKKMAFPGATLDERLKNLTPTIIPNAAEVQQAHTVRNNIVYDPNYRFSLDEARKNLSIFEKAFQALDLI